MAITPNQITDVFQKQVGRAPTPYEISKYSTASIQDLTGLKNTYSKYNPDQSVVDYLAFQGQDPSMKSRADLATKYGISGYTGSFDQNTKLLNSLKSGKTPETPAVNGTIANATPPSDQQFTDINESIDTALQNQYSKLDGTISGATQPETSTSSPVTDPNKPPVNPEVKVASETSTSSQKAVLNVTKRIDDINKSIDSSLQNKRDEIARSGGVVNESQLRSTVLAENAPLLAERKDLLTQRAQLVGEQTIADKAYQNAINSQKQSDANFFKEQSLNQGQQKIDQASSKMDIQQEQFAEKLKQSGFKLVNVATTDEYGNTIHTPTWYANPGDKQGITSDGKIVSKNSSGKTTTSTVTKPSQNPTETPMTTKSSIDISTPGYTTAMVLFNDGKKELNTQLTQSYIDQIAIQAIMNKGQIPAGAMRGTKGLPLIQTNAIKSRMGQLDPGGNLALNSALAKSWGDNLTKQISYATTLNRSLQSADADFKQILNKYQGTGINNSSLPLSNIINNFKKYNLGSGDVSAFKASLAELGNLYQQVFSRTGTVTDSVRAQAKDIIDGNLSIDNLAKVAEQLQALGKIDVDKANEAVQNSEKQFRGIVPGSDTTQISKGSMSNNQFVDKVLTSQGKNYDDFIKQYKKDNPGKIPLIENATGNIVSADSEEDITSDYTRI